VGGVGFGRVVEKCGKNEKPQVQNRHPRHPAKDGPPDLGNCLSGFCLLSFAAEMFPQIHFNFGPTSVDKLYQIALPLIPGSLVVAGTFVLRPSLRSQLVAIYDPHSYVWLGILIFCAYVVGYILYALSGTVAGLISGGLLLVFNVWNPERPNFLLSQRPIWRRVCAQFLGELAPVEPQMPPITAATVGNVGTMFQTNVNARMEYNAQWQEWYNVLQDYLLRGTPQLNPDAVFVLLGAQATGWALICLYVLSGHALPWTIVALAWVFVFVGSTFYFFSALSYATSDRLTYWDFTARLLAEIRLSTARVPDVDTAPKEAGWGRKLLEGLFGRQKSD
jgi:hypothetical protein